MAGIVLTVLKILGVAVLIIFPLILILLLLVLFFPIRYSFAGRVDDPEGSSEILHLDLKKDVSCLMQISWLMGLVRAQASFDGKPHLEAKIFGISLPVSRLMKKMEKGEKGKEKKEEKKEEKKYTIDEKIEHVLNQIEKILASIEDLIYVLNTERGYRTRQFLTRVLLPPVLRLAPEEWGITGVVGLGDPARSAKVFSVQGLLYPVTAGHVAVGTEYELYRYDLSAASRGRIRIFSLVSAVVRVIMYRDFRRMIKRIRRGLSASNGNGNGHRYKSKNGNSRKEGSNKENAA